MEASGGLFPHCQALADAARAKRMCSRIRYQLARAAGKNVALLGCAAFASPAPWERQGWRIHVGTMGVRAIVSFPAQRLALIALAFARDSRIASLAWDRRECRSGTGPNPTYRRDPRLARRSGGRRRRAAVRTRTRRCPAGRARRRPAECSRAGTSRTRDRNASRGFPCDQCAGNTRRRTRLRRGCRRDRVGSRFDAAERFRREVIRQAVVGEIGERMSQRRQFPVDDRHDARLGGMEDQILDAIVAVHDRDLVTGRNVSRQPLHQAIHRRNLVGLRRDVLLAPAPDLARVVVAGLAVISRGQSTRRRRRATAPARRPCPRTSPFALQATRREDAAAETRGRRRIPSRRTACR